MHSSEQTFQHLSAFWSHLSLHTRTCDASGDRIVSIYPQSCPYPVYHMRHWLMHDTTPGAHIDFEQPVFAQAWEVFRRSPIPHNLGEWSENCEYTDDAWYSKDCYLTHNMYQSQNTYYSHRAIDLVDCRYCIYTYSSQKCSDLVYCFGCFNLVYALNCKRCSDSAFLFDCEDCQDCILCWNLRNKRYCIGNRQLTESEYHYERAQYNLASRKVYTLLQAQFLKYIHENAWWKASHMLANENCTGDFLANNHNCHDCFIIDQSEDCSMGIRSTQAVSSSRFVSIISSDHVEDSVNIWEKSSNIRFSVNLAECRNMEYCTYCLRSSHCFLSIWLIDKEYYILNQPYTEPEYHILKWKIIDHMRKTGEYGIFFPAYFSPSAYDESLAGIYYPLSVTEQESFGFRTKSSIEKYSTDYKDAPEIPDTLTAENEQQFLGQVYWDKEEGRPIQFFAPDIALCRDLGIAPNDTFYLRRIRDNFSNLHFGMLLRDTICAQSRVSIQTTLPASLDGRILSVEAYDALF